LVRRQAQYTDEIWKPQFGAAKALMPPATPTAKPTMPFVRLFDFMEARLDSAMTALMGR
jgi:hypothetical protein